MRWAGLATDYKQEYRSLIDCNGLIAPASQHCSEIGLSSSAVRPAAGSASRTGARHRLKIMKHWFSWIPIHIESHDNQLNFVEQFNTNH